jgi:ribosome biogenesis GTPase
MTTCRIMADYGSGFIVSTPDGEKEAVWMRTGSERPCAGDLVMVKEEGTLLLVREILPRKYTLVRREPGSRGADQILSVNCGTALVFLSAARKRLRVPALLERWLVLLNGAEIKAAVLVNKIDTDPGWSDWIGELEAAAGEIPLFPVSLSTGEGWELLTGWLAENRAAIEQNGGLLLAGPSGAGKSTFANRLAGTELRHTGDVRETDGRGRHTTAERRLQTIPGWFTVMDTPGVKELGLPGEGAGATLEELYPEIGEYAEGCRFRDCRHAGEPGCAVQEALARGEIDFRRFLTWRELSEESGRGKRPRR